MSSGLPVLPNQNYTELVNVVTEELKTNLNAIAQSTVNELVDVIARANKIAVYGVGREGLAMKGFAMRLFHLGVNVFVVGEMVQTAVGKGDILLASAGPGHFSTVSAIAGEAQRAGCRVIGFTSQPPSPLQDWADLCIQVPATCLPPASLLDQSPVHLHRTGGVDGTHSILPMGSSYELALQLFFDVVALFLQQRLGIAGEMMKARHTNLE